MPPRPALCPLGRLTDRERQHYHDTCLCLDVHEWRPSGYPIRCSECGADQCGATIGLGQRCQRARGHGKRHLFPAA